MNRTNYVGRPVQGVSVRIFNVPVILVLFRWLDRGAIRIYAHMYTSLAVKFELLRYIGSKGLWREVILKCNSEKQVLKI